MESQEQTDLDEKSNGLCLSAKGPPGVTLALLPVHFRWGPLWAKRTLPSYSGCLKTPTDRFSGESDDLRRTFTITAFQNLLGATTSGRLPVSEKTDFSHRLRVKGFHLRPLGGLYDHLSGSCGSVTSFLVPLFGGPSHLGRAYQPSRF